MVRIKVLSKLAWVLSFAALFGSSLVHAIPKKSNNKNLINNANIKNNDFQIDQDGALVHYSGSDTNVIVPDGVRAISFGAFMDRPKWKP